MKRALVVVHASVAAKWFFDEPGSEEAAALRRDPGVRFHVPDVWYLEFASATWKRARRDPRFDAEGVSLVLEGIRAVPVRVRPASELAGRALAIAVEAGVSVYDAAYAATTELSEATLVTADVVLCRRLRAWRPEFPVELLGA